MKTFTAADARAQAQHNQKLVREQIQLALIAAASDAKPGASIEEIQEHARWAVALIEAEAFFDHASLKDVAQRLLDGVPAANVETWLDEQAQMVGIWGDEELGAILQRIGEVFE
jgi:hypothetical protein